MVTRYRIVHFDELNHYGVRGMKWGIRKAYPKNPKARNAKLKKYVKTGVKIAGGALAAYSVYKITSHPQVYRGEQALANILAKGHLGKTTKISVALANTRTVAGYGVVAGMLGTTGYKGYKKFNANYELKRK